MSANFTPNQNEYKNLTPFKTWLMLQINTWGMTNFPFVESDFDELTNYGMMLKLMDAVNDVIANENEVEQDMTNLFNAFTELQSYVNDYFDNLDVEDEINAKLDEMAQDGSLYNIIRQYTDPIIEDFENNVNETLDTELGNMQEQINAISSGSPRGVYASVSALTSADPNHDYIYLVTDDGKWYYHNGTTWIAGGTYQSTGIGDGTISLNMFGTDVIFNLGTRNVDGYEFKQVQKIDFTNNLVNKTISANGQIGSDSNTRVITNNLIYMPFNSHFRIVKNTENYKIEVYAYDKNFAYGGTSIEIKNNNYLFPNDNQFIRFRFNKADDTAEISIQEVLANVEIEFVANITDEKNENTIGTNLLNPAKQKDGFVNSATDPYSLLISGTYKSSPLIPVKKDQTYFVSRFRKFALYDKNFKFINGTFVDTNTSSYTFTPPTDGYAVFSYNTTNVYMVEGSTGTYSPYIETLPDYVQLSNITNLQPLLNATNILYNKKYVALGDSFTAGAFQDSPTNDYIIDGGLYDGQYKVYPYLIGNRNLMQITNLAVGGMTLANVNGTSTNYLSDAVLSNIPSDVDYITIKIGINDNPDHQNSPLGTIDSNDSTTFYGSFNRVMTNLITNHPNAKIGIIVSNGMISIDYVNATINIAKKYGVAYLNETTDENVPLLIRTLRNDVSNSIKNIRNQNWEVLPGTNYHPNAKCHEFESGIVEDFLRRL